MNTKRTKDINDSNHIINCCKAFDCHLISIVGLLGKRLGEKGAKTNILPIMEHISKSNHFEEHLSAQKSKQNAVSQGHLMLSQL